MKIDFSDLNYQYKILKKQIDKNLGEVIENSSFIGGSFIKKFEYSFSKFCESKYCLGVGNGTDAIEIAIQALNLPKNSEIIVPANTFIATAEAVIRSGNKVIFADVNYSNHLIDTQKLEKKITKRTSAIIPVHLYGQSCDMENLIKLIKKYKLKLIEDCSQAHGAMYKKKHVGTFGDFGTFSFYPGKNLGGFGDGGCIITNNNKLYLKCKRIANHGRLKKFDHNLVGRNSRLDNLQASILLEKLKLIHEWITKRNYNAKLYNKLLDKELIDVPIIYKHLYHSFHLYVVKVNKRNFVKKLLSEKGISTGIHYPQSLNQNKIFNVQKDDIKVSNKLSKKILSLPIHESLNNKQIIYVCKTLNKIVRDLN